MAAPSAASAKGLSVTVSDKPEAQSGSRSAEIEWTVRQGRKVATGVKLTCRLDGDLLKSCSSPAKLGRLKDGDHTFTISASKANGRRARLTGSATVKWTVDMADPTKPTLDGADGAWSATAVTVSAHGSRDPRTDIERYESQVSRDGGNSWTDLQDGASRTIEASGETRVRFRAVDGAGNEGPFAAGAVRIDPDAPAVPTVTGGNAAWERSTSRTVAGSSSDALSGIARLEVQTSVDGGVSWSSPANASFAVVTAEGTTSVRFRAIDNAGNVSGFSAVDAGSIVKLDRTAPAAPRVAGGSIVWGKLAPVLLTAAADDALAGVASVEWQRSVDGGLTWTDLASGASFSVLTQGETLLRFRVTDAAGNASPFSAVDGSSTARIDSSAPLLSVSGGSVAWRRSGAPFTITAVASDAVSGVTVERRTSTDDAATWSAWTSGTAQQVSAQGRTLVEFRATDAAGNQTVASHSAASTIWFDDVAPAVPTVSGGSLSWIDGTRTISAVSSDATSGGVTLERSSDGGTTWSAGSSLTVSAEGTTVVRFRATDAAGNVSAMSAVDADATAQIDTIDPVVTVAGGTGAWQQLGSLNVVATVADANAVAVEHRTTVDGGTPSAWTAGATVTAGQGVTLVEFRATDAAGNVGTASNTVKLDNVAPAVPTVSGGSLTWIDGTRTISAVSSDATSGGVTLERSSDGGTTWAAGSSLTVSAEGATVVRFRATDAAGNVSAMSAADADATARIDTIDPVVSVAGGTGAWQQLGSLNVVATVADANAATVEHRTTVDGGTPSAWTAGATVTAGQGVTLVEFRATDAAGNVGTASNTVKLDNVAPAVPTVSGGSLTWIDGTRTISATSTDATSQGLTYDRSTDAGTTWSAGDSLVVSADGTTVVRFRATDAAGNVSAMSVAGASATANIDTIDPAVSVAGGTGAWQQLGSLNVVATVTDATSTTVERRTTVDGGAPSAWTAGTSVTAGQGVTVVEFRATDAAGNVGTATNTVKLDNVAPPAPTVLGGNGAAGFQNLAEVPFTATATEATGSGVVGYRYQTSTDLGTTWSVLSAQTTGASVTAEGTTWIRFVAVDAAGNTSLASVDGNHATAMIDRTGPAAPTITGAPAGWSTAASVTLSATATDNASGVASYQSEVSLDGVTWDTPEAGATRTVTSEKVTHVRFRGVDTVGNSGTWASAIVRLDRSNPTVPVVSGGSAPAWTNAGSVAVTAVATDVVSEQVTYSYQTNVNGGGWGAFVPDADGIVNVTAEGVTQLQFFATDLALNNGATSTVSSASSVQIDRTPPSVSVTGGSDSWQDVVSDTVTATAADVLSGVSQIDHQTSTNGGTTWTPWTAGSSVTISDEGTTLVRYRATDNASNTSAVTTVSADSTVRIDRTDPVVTVAGGSLAWFNSASRSVTASATDATTVSYTHEVSTDAGPWSAPVAGATATVAAEGETLVRFTAVDAAGNTTISVLDASSTVRIDRQAPAVPTTVGSSTTWFSAASRTISASSSDAGSAGLVAAGGGLELQTSSNGGVSWTGWTAGDSIVVASEGETLVRFRALDNAGNASASSASAIVRLDRTAPSVPTITGGSSSWQSVANVTFTASSTDPLSGVSSYTSEVSLDAAAFGSPVAGATRTVSANGTHEVRFLATDAAGNSSVFSVPGASATAMIDRLAPNAPVNFTGGDLGWRSVPSVIVTAESDNDNGDSGVDRLEHRVTRDGGATWTVPAAGASATVSSDGNGWVEFRVVDVAGNATAWAPSTATGATAVLLDRTAPVVTVTGGSDAWDNSPPITITAAATDAGSGLDIVEYQTSTNGGATWSAVAEGTSVDVTAASQGTTLVRFRASDLSGNQGAWTPVTAASTAKVDTVLPDLTIGGGGSTGWQSVASVNVTATATDATSGVTTHWRASSDLGANWSTWTTYSGPVTVAAEGTTLFEFRATDGAGNERSESGTVATQVHIDRTAPTFTVTGGSASWFASSPQTVSAAIADGADRAGIDPATVGYQTSVDNSTWSAVVGASSTSVSAEGVTYVRFTATDYAGNAAFSTVDNASTVRIDTLLPTLTASGGAAAWSNATSVDVTAVASGTGSAVTVTSERSLDGGAWSAPVNGTGVSVTAEGQTQVRFTARDEANNTVSYGPVAGTSVWLDRTKPTVVASGGNGASALWTDVVPVTISASAADGALSGVNAATWQHEWRTNGGAWTPDTGSSIAVTAEGVTEVRFRVQDVAGNWSDWTTPNGASTARIDTVDPVLNTTGGSLAWVNAASGTVSATATDANAYVIEFQQRLAGGAWGAWAPGSSVTPTGEGAHEVQFRVRDVTGPANEVLGPVQHIRLDRSSPSVTAVSGGSTTWSNDPSVVVTSTGTDAISAIDRLEYRTSADGGITWSTLQSTADDVTVSAEGTTLVRFRAVDLAGNTSGYTNWPTPGSTVKLDRSLPTGTLAALGTIDGTVNVTGTHADQASLSGVATWSVEFDGPEIATFCPGSTSASPWSCSIDTTTLLDGTYDVYLHLADAAGNTATVSGSAVVNNNGPSGTAAVTSEDTNDTSQETIGGTHWFNPASSGSFTVTVTTGGPSPITGVSFPSLGAGWTGGGTDTTAPYTMTYAWAGGAVSPGPVNAVVTDDTLRSGNAAFTVSEDAFPPVVALSHNGGLSVDWNVTDANTSTLTDITWTSDKFGGPATDDGSCLNDPAASGTCAGPGALAPGESVTYTITSTDSVGNIATDTQTHTQP